MVREPPRQHRATLIVLAALVVLIVGSLIVGLALSM
jgi:hypothetical protein